MRRAPKRKSPRTKAAAAAAAADPAPEGAPEAAALPVAADGPAHDCAEAAAQPPPAKKKRSAGGSGSAASKAAKAPPGPVFDHTMRPAALDPATGFRILSWNVAGLRALLKEVGGQWAVGGKEGKGYCGLWAKLWPAVHRIRRLRVAHKAS